MFGLTYRLWFCQYYSVAATVFTIGHLAMKDQVLHQTNAGEMLVRFHLTKNGLLLELFNISN